MNTMHPALLLRPGALFAAMLVATPALALDFHGYMRSGSPTAHREAETAKAHRG